MIHTLIDPTLVYGTGSDLWTVVYIDTQDPENTSIWYWRADDQDHLRSQVCEDHSGYPETDLEREMGESNFNENWGVTILHTHLGMVKDTAETPEVPRRKEMTRILILSKIIKSDIEMIEEWASSNEIEDFYMDTITDDAWFIDTSNYNEDQEDSLKSLLKANNIVWS